MGRIEQALDQVSAALTSAINVAGYPSPYKGQVYIGWPTGPELTEILNQQGYAVSMYPTGGGQRIPARPFYEYRTVIPSSLLVTVSANTLTYSGTVTAGTNAYAYVTHPTLGLQIAYVQTIAGDTLTTVATKITAAISGLTSPISATSSGAVVTVTGGVQLDARVCATGNVGRELARIKQMVQISIWASSPFQRANLVGVLEATVGIDDNPYVDLGDGSSAKILAAAPAKYIDESVRSMNLYEAHSTFTAEYGIMGNTSATQVGQFTETVTIVDSGQTFTIVEE